MVLCGNSDIHSQHTCCPKDTCCSPTKSAWQGRSFQLCFRVWCNCTNFPSFSQISVLGCYFSYLVIPTTCHKIALGNRIFTSMLEELLDRRPRHFHRGCTCTNLRFLTPLSANIFCCRKGPKSMPRYTVRVDRCIGQRSLKTSDRRSSAKGGVWCSNLFCH